MKVLIVDNYDSFTFNLKHYVEQFSDYVVVGRGSDIDVLNLDIYDKIILSPGPGLPAEHPILDKILSMYYFKKSILGVCLGHQAIASFFGARLINLNRVKHGVSSHVLHANNCKIFNKIPTSFEVGHYHSWVVSKDHFPKDLYITSENEEGIITSIRHRKYDLTGIQFHPESILTHYGLELLRNWLLD